MNRKWNSSILGHFKKLRKCYHMTKSSSTCFLGHFMIPRVQPNFIYTVPRKILTRQRLTHFWNFEHNWKTSIFDEGLYIVWITPFFYSMLFLTGKMKRTCNLPIEAYRILPLKFFVRRFHCKTFFLHLFRTVDDKYATSTVVAME